MQGLARRQASLPVAATRACKAALGIKQSSKHALANAAACTSRWSASHSGHESETMMRMESGWPAASALQAPAQGAREGGWRAGSEGGWKAVCCFCRHPRRTARSKQGAEAEAMQALLAAGKSRRQRFRLTSALVGALHLEALAAAVELVGGGEAVGEGEGSGGEVGVPVEWDEGEGRQQQQSSW